MLFTIAGLTRLAPDTPTNTSAPCIASASVRSFVLRAKPFLKLLRSVRSLCTTPLESTRVILDFFAPIATSSFIDAMPAAPAPRQTIFARLQRLALHMQRVDEAGADDDGGAVLVVVEYRDVEFLLQRGFDFEAMRRGDVFEVDAAEGRRDRLDHLDEFLRRLGVDLDVEHVDAGELLEQHGLAFHHRLGGERTAIAQTQDRGAVGDHGNQIALVGVVVGGLGIFGDFQHRLRHARGVGERQVFLGGTGFGGFHREFARLGQAVVIEGFFLEFGGGHGGRRRLDRQAAIIADLFAFHPALPVFHAAVSFSRS